MFYQVLWMLFPLSLKCERVLGTLTQSWLFCSSLSEGNPLANYNSQILHKFWYCLLQSFGIFLKGGNKETLWECISIPHSALRWTVKHLP